MGIVKKVDSVVNNSKNYAEIRLYLASLVGKPVTDMNLKDKQAAIEILAEKMFDSITDLENSRPFVEDRWSFIGNVRPIIEEIYGDNVQFQQRTQALTDREVLEQAAKQLVLQDLTDGERDALNIFIGRLELLKDLQEQRKQQGQLRTPVAISGKARFQNGWTKVGQNWYKNSGYF